MSSWEDFLGIYRRLGGQEGGWIGGFGKRGGSLGCYVGVIIMLNFYISFGEQGELFLFYIKEIEVQRVYGIGLRLYSQ